MKIEYLVEMKQGTFTKSPEEGITFIEIMCYQPWQLPKDLSKKRRLFPAAHCRANGFAFVIMLNPLRRLMKF
jgi:hypothetical protein